MLNYFFQGVVISTMVILVVLIEILKLISQGIVIGVTIVITMRVLMLWLQQ